MTEFEKVIKGLEICAGGSNSCTPCPFKDNCKGTSNAAMAAAIKLLKAQEAQGWISVKDRLPKEGKTVFVARKYVQPGRKETRYVETAGRIGLDWVSAEDEYKVHRSFHTQPYAWMPLPEPPKEEENG